MWRSASFFLSQIFHRLASLEDPPAPSHKRGKKTSQSIFSTTCIILWSRIAMHSYSSFVLPSPHDSAYAVPVVPCSSHSGHCDTFCSASFYLHSGSYKTGGRGGACTRSLPVLQIFRFIWTRFSNAHQARDICFQQEVILINILTQLTQVCRILGNTCQNWLIAFLGYHLLRLPSLHVHNVQIVLNKHHFLHNNPSPISIYNGHWNPGFSGWSRQTWRLFWWQRLGCRFPLWKLTVPIISYK